MFAFPSLCSFFILVLNNIAAESLAREGACDTQLLQVIVDGFKCSRLWTSEN